MFLITCTNIPNLVFIKDHSTIVIPRGKHRHGTEQYLEIRKHAYLKTVMSAVTIARLTSGQFQQAAATSGLEWIVQSLGQLHPTRRLQKPLDVEEALREYICLAPSRSGCIAKQVHR